MAIHFQFSSFHQSTIPLQKNTGSKRLPSLQKHVNRLKGHQKELRAAAPISSGGGILKKKGCEEKWLALSKAQNRTRRVSRRKRSREHMLSSISTSISLLQLNWVNYNSKHISMCRTNLVYLWVSRLCYCFSVG